MKYWQYLLAATFARWANVYVSADATENPERKDFTITNQFKHSIALDYDDGNGGSFMVSVEVNIM
jgi:hypothetical protein